jgi:serine/threonine protein kinase
LLANPEDGERRILLSDFGIARNVNDISGLTKTNMTVGTVAYCAPEQLLGEDIDGRTDQYSLAASAFHLLTGSQLFPHSNPAVVISRHLNMPPPALADTRPELAALDPVLAIALAKNPDDRFRQCRDFAHALSLARIQARIGDINQSATLLAIDAKEAIPSAKPGPVRRNQLLLRSQRPAQRNQPPRGHGWTTLRN